MTDIERSHAELRGALSLAGREIRRLNIGTATSPVLVKLRAVVRLACLCLTGLNLSAQTQIDLHTQSKGVDFQAAPYTKPLKASATLPANCTVNELLLLTTAPSGSNIYACMTPDIWVPEGGTAASPITIQNDGVEVGIRPTENFVPGLGLTNVITDLGTKINIQQGIDTSAVVSQAALQSGQGLFCQSASGSNSTYTCNLSPTLTGYTTGMVVFWKPDLSGIGGATTLDIDLVGAVPLVTPGGTNLGPTDIAANELYPIWFDGTAFRLLAGAAGAGAGANGGGTTPTSIVSTNAGGQTALTAASEWHSALAYCSGPSTSMLVWNAPPSGTAAAAATGCGGTSVNDAYAGFANVGMPSLQTSFMLPQTLTGNADVFITYLTSAAGGTFVPALDVVCTAANNTATNDPAFSPNNFFTPGATIAPAMANTLGTISAQGLSWPAGCTAGTRAHLRLIRTDTSGTAASVSIAEVVIVLRRLL